MFPWVAGAAVAGTCAGEAVDALAKVIAEAPKDQRLVIAAGGWAPLCTGDGVLDMQFGQIAEASADHRLLVELQTGVLDPGGWKTACAGGPLALSMATKLDAGQQRAFLWEKCGVERFGAFTAEEWTAASGLLVLPIWAASALAAGEVPAERARPIVRALAGL